MLERLQKVLAARGVASRRACEELIREGRVTVNGRTVDQLGTKVDSQKDKIQVDGEGTKPRQIVCYVLNKPRGLLCTNRDEFGRRTAVGLMESERARLFAAGRLDKESEGLLIVTNDGELTNILTHPRHGVDKTYLVVAKGAIPPEQLEALRRGVFLSEGKTAPVRATLEKVDRDSVEMELTLREGRNREVRRMLARYGIKVKRLKRIRIGSIHLGTLKPGESRRLTPREEEYIAGLKEQSLASPRPGRRRQRYARTRGRTRSSGQQTDRSFSNFEDVDTED